MEYLDIIREVGLLIMFVCAVPLFFISIKLFMMEVEELFE